MTTDRNDPPNADAPGERAFVVPCRTVSPGQIVHWLQRGWLDLIRAPALSLLFGGVIALISVAISALAWMLGRFALLAILLSGFVFIAPLLGGFLLTRAGATPMWLVVAGLGFAAAFLFLMLEGRVARRRGETLALGG